MAKENWTPNETQKKFMAVLKDLPDGEALTLAEISKRAGVEFKTGSINSLLTKGLVDHGEDIIVEVVRVRKEPKKTYKLVR